VKEKPGNGKEMGGDWGEEMGGNRGDAKSGKFQSSFSCHRKVRGRRGRERGRKGENKGKEEKERRRERKRVQEGKGGKGQRKY